jgi:hypothetical protein
VSFSFSRDSAGSSKLMIANASAVDDIANIVPHVSMKAKLSCSL